MTTDKDDGQEKLIGALLQMAQQRQSSALPITAIVFSVAAMGLSGFAAYNALSIRHAEVAPVAGLTASPQPTATTTLSTPPPPASSASAAPTPQMGSGDQNVRIAQSEDGNIYAFSPEAGITFRFDAGSDAAGPIAIDASQLPEDVREKLATAGPMPGSSADSPAIDGDALDAQTARARAAIAAGGTDQSRPPINRLLKDPEIAASIVTSLDQAQGITIPAGENETPEIYAFFDPQCPYCQQAFEGMTGRFSVKWMPLSALGPQGDPMHVYIMDEVELVSQEIDGETMTTGRLSDDNERVTRLAVVMTGDADVSKGELTEGQRAVLAENAELFRLLSKGAEELRAVPSFFIRSEDGSAVWLRGYEAATPDVMDDIIASGE